MKPSPQNQPTPADADIPRGPAAVSPPTGPAGAGSLSPAPAPASGGADLPVSLDAQPVPTKAAQQVGPTVPPLNVDDIFPIISAVLRKRGFQAWLIRDDGSCGFQRLDGSFHKFATIEDAVDWIGFDAMVAEREAAREPNAS